jgi:arylsulfatase A-like enzyme/Tfp pilus assembly protein PilF
MTVRKVRLKPDTTYTVVCVIAFACLAGCGRTPAKPANAGLRPGALAKSNVLLVTIDTLRADRVGAYSGRTLTPTLDALAARGVRFARAWAHVPLTLPAHTSILTGLIPPTHGVHNNGSTALAPETPTLASLLHDAGYRTGAFVGAFVLDARFGLSRGFDIYDDRVGSDTGPVTFAFAERSAVEVVRLAGDWILQSAISNQSAIPSQSAVPIQSAIRNPQSAMAWFAWIHLFDPHAPYRAPEQRAADPYDNEVAFADAQLGALLERLRTAGQLDSTLVVVVADHGESLGDHGEATHGLFAYEPTLRIPLIIAGPSIQPAVVDAAASQSDLLPTIVEMLGVKPPSRVDGQSMLPALRGEPAPDRPIYFEALDAYLTRHWAPLTGIVSNGWKYIDLPDAELYDLAQDPGELHNQVGNEHDRAVTLGRRLTEWAPLSTLSTSSRQPARDVPIDADAAARLRSLGYTASQSRPAAPKSYTSADDPKRLLDLDRRYERALTLTGERQYAEAAALLQSVVADRPDFTVAYLNLASVYIASGDPRRAIVLIEDAAKRGVTSPELQARLGTAYLTVGDLDRASATLAPVARPEIPGGLDAMNSLGIILTQQRRYDRARKLLSDVLARSPRSATTWSNLGLLELQDHRLAEASRAFEQAVAADPRLGQAWEGLGASRIGADPAAAIDAWRRALELEPRNYDLLFNLVATLRDRGRAAEARPYAERFVREAPPERYTRDIEAIRSWLNGQP